MLHSAPDRRLPTITISQRGTSGNNSSEAATFLITAGITDYTQTTAINYLVDSLKDAGLWTKMKVIYPFVGGTTQAHQLNLKDPTINLLTFSNITHSSAGISATNIASVGSAVSAYSSVNDSTTDTSFGCYGTTIYSSPNNIFLGDGSAGTANSMGVATAGNNVVYYRAMGNLIGATNNGYVSGFLGGDGFKMVSILGTTARISTNQIEAAPATSGSTKGNLGWRLFTNAANTTSNTFSFFFVGNGLTSAEMLTLHNIVGTYQDILGRSLYTFNVSLHPWTNRFVSLTTLTDATQITALNQLINSLDNNGWLNTSILYVYPFLGGDLTKYAFAIDGSAGTIGSNTYNTLGLDPNAVANAGINTAVLTSVLGASGGCIGFYCNEDTNVTAFDIISASSTSQSHIGIAIRNTSNQIQVLMYGGGTLTTVGTNTNAIGSYHLQIPAGYGASISSTLYKNGVAYGTTVPHGTTVGSGTAQRVPGSFTNAAGASRRFAISYIGVGSFTAGQIATLNTIIQNFVTALGRQ